MAEKRICLGKKKNGLPCGMPPKLNSDFCFRHDPESKEEAKEASRQGGQNRKSVIPDAPDVKVQCCLEVKNLMEYVTTAVIKGELAPAIVMAVNGSAKIMLDAMNTANAEKLVEELKEARAELEKMKNDRKQQQHQQGIAETQSRNREIEAGEQGEFAIEDSEGQSSSDNDGSRDEAGSMATFSAVVPLF